MTDKWYQVTWEQVRYASPGEVSLRDAFGLTWTQSRFNSNRIESPSEAYGTIGRQPDPMERFEVLLPDLPEPPDGTRLEFEHQTDVYAAWRDDDSSEEAGWTPGDGGDVWCVYPSSVPTSWVGMLLQFGDSLAKATLFTPAGPAFPGLENS